MPTNSFHQDAAPLEGPTKKGATLPPASQQITDGNGAFLFKNPAPDCRSYAVQTLRNRDGAVMYKGRAANLKSLLGILVANGKSLAKAQLRRYDLSGLDLDGAILDEADLDGADLRGMSAKGGSFVNASLRGVRAQGLLAEHANFQGADLGPDRDLATRYDFPDKDAAFVRSHFEGARLGYSNHDGAVHDHAVFDHANMGRCVMTRVVSRHASYRDATMPDVDYSFGTYIDPDFRGAHMKTTTKLDSEHLPDRTVGTTCVNGHFDKAKMDDTLINFMRDRTWSRSLRALAYVASSAAIISAMHYLGVEHGIEYVGEHIEPLRDFVKDGATLIVVSTVLTTAGMVIKDKLAESLRDKLADTVDGFNIRVRHACESAISTGINVKNLVVASLHGPGPVAILSALNATKWEASKKGFFSRFLSYDTPKTTVIFTDKRHLALALETLCSAKTRHRLNGDVILVRNDIDYGEDSPSVIRLRADGITSLAWTSDGKLLGTADFDRDGARIGAGFAGTARISGHMRAFERAILNEHGVRLLYDNKTSELRAGRDGSIIVLNRKTRRPNNPYDAALLTPDGGRRLFREGLEIEQDNTPHAAPDTESLIESDTESRIESDLESDGPRL